MEGLGSLEKLTKYSFCRVAEFSVPPGQGQIEGRFLFRWRWPLGLWEVYGLRKGALGQTPVLGLELEE
jgi:hypothetical protein